MAAEEAYKYLKQKNLLLTIKNEINHPNIHEAINQLEILARRGYFSIPTYNYKEKWDQDGNPFWKSYCSIEEIDFYTKGYGTSKKTAKKEAAFKMLTSILEKEYF